MFIYLINIKKENGFIFLKQVFFLNKTVYMFFFCVLYVNEIYEHGIMDGYGNDFTLFYNTDIISIRFIITIGCLYDDL